MNIKLLIYVKYTKQRLQTPKKKKFAVIIHASAVVASLPLEGTVSHRGQEGSPLRVGTQDPGD